jgi:hypothetical protein
VTSSLGISVYPDDGAMRKPCCVMRTRRCTAPNGKAATPISSTPKH